MGVDVHLDERFAREGERRRTKRGRPADRPVIDSLHPCSETLTDFLWREPVVQRSPVLSRWDPVGRSHAHTGSDLEAIIDEVEEARSLAGSTATRR